MPIVDLLILVSSRSASLKPVSYVTGSVDGRLWQERRRPSLEKGQAALYCGFDSISSAVGKTLIAPLGKMHNRHVLAGFSLFKTSQITKDGLVVQMADIRIIDSLVKNAVQHFNAAVNSQY